MDANEIAKEDTKKEWQRRMIDFTTAMTELVYWDKKPLEQAFSNNILLRQENERLKNLLHEIEIKTGFCPECGAEQIVEHKENCSHYIHPTL